MKAGSPGRPKEDSGGAAHNFNARGAAKAVCQGPMIPGGRTLPVVRKSRTGRPDAVDRHHMQALLRGVRTLPKVEGNTGQERLTNGGTQLAQRLQVLPLNAPARLHLEAHYGPVVSFNHEVYF